MKICKCRKNAYPSPLTPLDSSSKELGFFNPRSQLDSTVVTYCPMQLKNGGTGKGEWEREGATLVEGRGKTQTHSCIA